MSSVTWWAGSTASAVVRAILSTWAPSPKQSTLEGMGTILSRRGASRPIVSSGRPTSGVLLAHVIDPPLVERPRRLVLTGTGDRSGIGRGHLVCLEHLPRVLPRDRMIGVIVICGECPGRPSDRGPEDEHSQHLLHSFSLPLSNLIAQSDHSLANTPGVADRIGGGNADLLRRDQRSGGVFGGKGNPRVQAKEMSRAARCRRCCSPKCPGGSGEHRRPLEIGGVIGP